MGPYIPIYGVGTVLIGLLLSKYKNDPIVFFCMSVILCSFVEYITSYIMEKIFKVRWWDYSHEPFNYNGRICLKNSMLFGIAGLFLIYTYYPFLLNFLYHLSPFVLILLSVIFFSLFMIDLIFTVTALFRVKNNLLKFAGCDATEEARHEVMRVIKKHDFSLNRLLQAFPKSVNFNRHEFKEFRKSVIEYRKKRKEKRKEKRKNK